MSLWSMTHLLLFLPFDPAVVQATSVQVSWLGFASNTITQYDIYYRVAPSTTWINWNSYGAGGQHLTHLMRPLLFPAM